MNWQAFVSIFATILVAEIGDKTQLATLLFSADGTVSRWMVFAASASALALVAGIGVLVGAQLERFVSPVVLKRIAGVRFITIGRWTLLSK